MMNKPPSLNENTQWQQKLTPEQYRVLREHGTEAPWSSPLNQEHRPGVYACAACGAELFRSDSKFNSGTGWPSFSDVIPGSIQTRPDNTLASPRIEYHCAACGGHLGHVFADGPAPTGLRYCNNGVCLTFKPE